MNERIAYVMNKSFEKWFSEINKELRKIKEECFLTDEELAELVIVEFYVDDIGVSHAIINFKEGVI